VRKNSITDYEQLDEPPDADPHVRWCEREQLVTAPYSILPELCMLGNLSWRKEHLVWSDSLASFRAKFILTDGSKGTDWAIQVAHRLVKENHHYLMLDQFGNPANPEAH
jgi:hypothetical protein